MRRQPIGPYILGGWSAGGVVAYEVAKQLSYLSKANPDKNWYVEKLILIDSPCPVKLEPLPARLHHFFDEIGLLDEAGYAVFDEGQVGKVHAEEGNARWIRFVEGFAVLGEVFGGAHEFAHGFEGVFGLAVDLLPGAREAVNGCCAEGRDD